MGLRGGLSNTIIKKGGCTGDELEEDLLSLEAPPPYCQELKGGACLCRKKKLLAVTVIKGVAEYEKGRGTCFQCGPLTGGGRRRRDEGGKGGRLLKSLGERRFMVGRRIRQRGGRG